MVSVGTVVLINFPYADLKRYKKRPAVVVADSSLDTVILCQITSRKLPDVPAIPITKNDFASGGLPFTSYVRPDKLFTVNADMAKSSQLGVLTDQKLNELKLAIKKLF
ncbi:MAG: type II toxin-antitoxin system PemK/MazF family toxin [Patescibacteria group bacterium]